MSNSFDIPQAFVCPITLTIMKNPVIDTDGNTFEEEAILQWIDIHHNSPVTRNPMTRSSIKPNRALKGIIEAYLLNPNGNGHLTGSTVNTRTGTGNETAVMLDRDPISIIMIADVSGSMGAISSNKNSTEKMNFTSLDLVKHTMNTIVESLTPHDSISIIKFNDVATQVTDLIPVNTGNKSFLKDKITELEASGGTNIWDALRVSIEIAKTSKGGTGKVHLLLFTDGESNADPPRGIIPTLTDFLAKENDLRLTLNTYGFGSSINSDLLYQISELKNGIFGFIPDSTMIGTVFVNSVAHLMTHNHTSTLTPFEDIVRIELVNKLKTGKFSEFSTFIQQHRSYGIPFIDDIFIDCIDSTNDSDGQIFKAFEPHYYRTWGQHYIRSVISAYNNKFCLNFKDHGVQHFKTPNFDKYQRVIEDVFINLPPPIPTGKSYDGHTNAPVSSQNFTMSFYNPSGGCFAKDTLVHLVNNDYIPVQYITPGTKLYSSRDDSHESIVVCVVKLKFTGTIRSYVHFNSTALTPYHPIYLDDQKEWVFPKDSHKFTDVQVNDVYVYDFVLDSHHTVELYGGITAVTFGHGFEEEVVGHDYFGTSKIIDDLRKHPTWDTGVIVLDDYQFIRDPQTNLVTNLKF